MPLIFPPAGSPQWYRYYEQAVLQRHVDLQRLWQVTPQIPDPQAGLPFTLPSSPTAFFVPPAFPVSSASSSSSSGP